MSVLFETKSPDETMAIGEKLAARVKPGDVIAMYGDLGVGKTHFSAGFARGLGIDDDITSPTFTIVCEYQDGSLPFYHMDAYRIEDIDELFAIGFDEYIFGQGVCLIEWANLIEEALPADIIKVTIKKNLDKGVDFREIVISGIDEL